MNTDFKGKVIVLSGVGRAGQVGDFLARAFADQGGTLQLVGRNRAELDARAEELRASHASVETHACDLSDARAAEDAARAVAAQTDGRVDALVHVAGGFALSGPLAESSVDVWQQQLSINLGTAFLASSVLGMFEGELQKMVALAVLAPIVASQGGNATTQTMTVVVRALATRELGTANAGRVIVRELLVGLLNGVAFAVITGAAAYAWFKVPGLGVVIGLAMICNLVAAALGGILIPLALYRLGRDPAVASSPFVTTVTDIVGFFSFLAIASLWFGLK